ncbi:hypothetical protein HKD28_15055 [Gluconobacter sp. LMG 1744]|uniref:hypothetical protein n=1 Tax=Gluconobacter cadivus TaxID=2728101 RepID=UPI0018859371|nr:hypothetical protein [Gluconobacter cadivus]MBF0892709.1 hypothetical protein [Gluconobacter cadivus]
MESIINVFDNIVSLYPDPVQRISIMITMFASVGYDPNNRVLVPTANEATATSLRIMLLSYMSAAVSEVEFDSSSSANSLLSTLRPLFNAQMTDKTLDANGFNRLQRLFGKIVADISSRGSTLPQVVSFYVDPSDDIPLPVLAQYIYQDGSRSDEILLRNNSTVVHPLFVNTTLEIIDNG